MTWVHLTPRRILIPFLWRWRRAHVYVLINCRNMYTLGRHVSRFEHTMDNRVLCNCNGECLWSPTMRRCVLDDAFFLLVYRFVENLDYFRWILDRFVCGKLSRLVWGCVSMVSVSENVIVWVCLCDVLWSTVVTKLLYLCIGLMIVSVFIKYVIIFFFWYK